MRKEFSPGRATIVHTYVVCNVLLDPEKDGVAELLEQCDTRIFLNFVRHLNVRAGIQLADGRLDGFRESFEERSVVVQVCQEEVVLDCSLRRVTREHRLQAQRGRERERESVCVCVCV
jgi:hypothetical protein